MWCISHHAHGVGPVCILYVRNGGYHNCDCTTLAHPDNNGDNNRKLEQLSFHFFFKYVGFSQCSVNKICKSGGEYFL